MKIFKQQFETITIPFTWMEDYKDIYLSITEDYAVNKSAIFKDLFPDLNKLDRDEIVCIQFDHVEEYFGLVISKKLHDFIMRYLWDKHGLSDE